METFFRFFVALIVFASIAFLAYITSRVIGMRTARGFKGKLIGVMDMVSLGIDKQLYIVKVGNQYFLISSAGKNIELLSEINPESIDFETVPEELQENDFSRALNKYMQALVDKIQKKKEAVKLQKQNVDKTGKAAASAQSNFAVNLERLRMLARKEDQNKTDEDEN